MVRKHAVSLLLILTLLSTGCNIAPDGTIGGGNVSISNNFTGPQGATGATGPAGNITGVADNLTAHNASQTVSHNLSGLLALKANLASPTFTGNSTFNSTSYFTNNVTIYPQDNVPVLTLKSYPCGNANIIYAVRQDGALAFQLNQNGEVLYGADMYINAGTKAILQSNARIKWGDNSSIPVNTTLPVAWLPILLPDGTTAYIPAYK